MYESVDFRDSGSSCLPGASGFGLRNRPEIAGAAGGSPANARAEPRLQLGRACRLHGLAGNELLAAGLMYVYVYTYVWIYVYIYICMYIEG